MPKVKSLLQTESKGRLALDGSHLDPTDTYSQSLYVGRRGPTPVWEADTHTRTRTRTHSPVLLSVWKGLGKWRLTYGPLWPL